LSWLDRADSNSDHIRTADVLRLAERGVLDGRNLDRALQLAGRVPTARGWRVAIDRLLLGLGVALLVAGVVCMVAYNWSSISRWGRFALAQAVLLLVFGLALGLGAGSRYSKPVLAMAIGLIGPLLALFGQTYQSGADVADLFVTWAVLALPWVLASRFAPAWLSWLAIVETGLVLHVVAFDLWQTIWLGFVPTWAWACLLNLLALIAWEYLACRLDWLRGRLGPTIVATCLVGLLTGLSCAAVWSVESPGLVFAPLAWVLALAAGYLAYRVRGVDLGMLALGWLSVTVVLLAALGRVLSETRGEAFAFVLGAGILIASSALGRQWLKDVGSGGAGRAGTGKAGTGKAGTGGSGQGRASE
jgi:uncharacterized membrane protein